VDLQSAIDSLPLDSDILCGSISVMLDKPGSLGGNEHGTAEADTEKMDHGTVSDGYSEVQLAAALQWDEKQRKMILLEQLLMKNDLGKYSGKEI